MTHISLDPNYIYCHCIRAICICTMSASFGVLADIVKKVQVALLFVNVLLILTHFDDRPAPVKKQAIYISWSKKAGTTMGNTFRSTLCFESLSKLHKKTGNRMYNRARWDWPSGPKCGKKLLLTPCQDSVVRNCYWHLANTMWLKTVTDALPRQCG